MNEDVDISRRLPPVVMKFQTVRASSDPVNVEAAARKIQTWWISVKNKRLFSLLKSGICCAEHSVTHEILRKLIPREAELLQDPTIQPRVRFRLKGDRFPPTIVFKVFMECRNIKYISGKNTIRPTSEASEDARKQMGNRIYFDQLLHDACQHQELEITDVIDIATLKDYMKYKSGLDESPAYLGGRDNYWRNLTLDVLPRHTKMYDILEFLTDTTQMGRSFSMGRFNDLTSPMNLQPERQLIRTAPSVRISSSLSVTPQKKERSVTSKGSRQSIAKRRADKMRLNYTPQQQDSENKPINVCSSQSDVMDYSDMDEDYQAVELYEWTQELSFEELN